MKKSIKTRRNKVILSLALIAASGMYALSQFTGSASPAAASSAAPSAQVAQSAAAAPKNGLYADGSYTGTAADAYYGTVQVKAVVQNGKIANVQFLQYPNSHNTSVYINNQAMPILTSEAIQVQSANVNAVSGATFTSQAFQQSLASALTQARA